MASAVLASRNETHWGENKVYMRKYTNNNINNNPNLSRFNPNHNPNPNSFSSWNPSPSAHSSRQINDASNGAPVWHSHEQSPMSPPPATLSRDSYSSINRKVTNTNLDEHNESSSQCRYVTFRLVSYSRRELKQLKKQLISELNQVRTLRNWIDVPDQFYVRTSDRCGEVIRPPPSQLDHALLSPKEKETPKVKNNNKRAMPFSSGRGKKRPAGADSPMGQLMTSMMRKCGQILTRVMRHKHGWVFNCPVDVVRLGLYDYHKIIRNPMDLGTIKSKLGKNEYRSPLDFSSDVKLTFNNAMIYNPKGSDVYVMAQILLSIFEGLFNPAYQKFDADRRRVVAAEQVNQQSLSLPPSVVHVPVVANKSNSMLPQATLPSPAAEQIQASTLTSPVRVPAKKPGRPAATIKKPKARDVNKRQMTFDEKAELAMNLSKLPPGPDGMDQMMRIIKKRVSALVLDEGEEIELDVEALDNETLWELDRFVAKAAAKMRREGGVRNLVSDVQINNSPTRELPTEQKGKKGDAGEEDVDIGEEIPITNFPFVEIERDVVNGGGRSSSSSGSSSGSDSSSSGSDSDSDSGSSSGGDSDVDNAQSQPSGDPMVI